MPRGTSGPGTAERLVGTAVERFGGLDILVNDSGGPPGGGFTDFDDAAWQDAFDLLLLSVVRMVRPGLRSPGRCRWDGVGEPAELASLVAFLCAASAAYLTGLSVPL